MPSTVAQLSSTGKTLPHGAFSAIARRLRPKVTPQHVRAVYLGERQSPRVERAIANYLARLDRERANEAA